MCALFGTYFVFFVRLSLPRYYDGERIGAFYDGPVRINLPGAAFNNRNWPHVLRVYRTWLCLTAALYPVSYTHLDLGEYDALVVDAEHGPLGYEQHVLAAFHSVCTAEGHLLDLLHVFLVPPLLEYDEPAVPRCV